MGYQNARYRLVQHEPRLCDPKSTPLPRRHELTVTAASAQPPWNPAEYTADRARVLNWPLRRRLALRKRGWRWGLDAAVCVVGHVLQELYEPRVDVKEMTNASPVPRVRQCPIGGTDHLHGRGANLQTEVLDFCVECRDLVIGFEIGLRRPVAERIDLSRPALAFAVH